MCFHRSDKGKFRCASLQDFFNALLGAKKPQTVTHVTDSPSRLQHGRIRRWIPAMKEIFVILALGFTFTTVMAVITVVTHPDQVMADGGGCSRC